MTSLQFKGADNELFIIPNNYKGTMFSGKEKSMHNIPLTRVTKLSGITWFYHNFKLFQNKMFYEISFTIPKMWFCVENFVVILNCRYA